MPSVIIDRDKGYAKLMQAYQSTYNVHGFVDVGVPDTPHEPTGTPMDEIGEVHEFGNGPIPQRSFLRRWFDENLEDIRKQLKARAENVLMWRTDTMEGALSKFATFAITGIQETIKGNIPPNLAYQTVKRKGNALALVASGQLLGSLVGEVKTKNGTLTVKGGSGLPEAPDSQQSSGMGAALMLAHAGAFSESGSSGSENDATAPGGGSEAATVR